MKLKVKGKEYNISSLTISQKDMEEIYNNSPEFDPMAKLGKLSVNGYEFLFVTDAETGCRVCYALNTNKKANAITYTDKKTGASRTVDMTPQWHFVRNVAVEDVTVKDKKGNIVTEGVVDKDGNPVMIEIKDESGKSSYVQEKKDVTRPEILFGFSNHGSMKTGSGKNGIRVTKNVADFDAVYSEVEEVVAQPGYDSLYNEMYKGVRTFSLNAVEESAIPVEEPAKDETIVQPTAPVTTEKEENKISVYTAELDEASKELVYFISAPHWKEKNRKLAGKEGKTLYMVKESDLDKNGWTIEDLIACSKNENELADALKDSGLGNAVAVKNIEINKVTGSADVTYYGKVNGKLKDNLKLKIKDTKVNEEENLKTWTDANYGKNKVEFTKTSTLVSPMVKKPVTTALVLGVVIAALAAGHFIASTNVKNTRINEEYQTKLVETAKNKENALKSIKDQTEAAKQFGVDQAKEDLKDKDLFRVVTKADGSKVVEMGEISQIFNGKLEYFNADLGYYTNALTGEQMPIKRDDLSLEQRDMVDGYRIATLEGYFGEVGKASVGELAEDGFPVAYRDLDGEVSANYVYVVPTTGVRPDANLNPEEMEKYILHFVGNNNNLAEWGVDYYADYYAEGLGELMAKGGLDEQNFISQEAPVVKPVEFNGVEVRTALANETGEDATLFYVDADMAFAMSDERDADGMPTAIWQIDLADNANTKSDEGLAEAIEKNDGVNKAVTAEYMLGKSVDGNIYIVEGTEVTHRTENGYSLNSTIIEIDGNTITVDDRYTISCKQDKQMEMLEFAIFADTLENVENFKVDLTGSIKTYDQNEMAQEAVNAVTQTELVK